MSKLLAAVGVLAVGVGAGAVYLQQQDNRALRREVALLREEWRLEGAARGAEFKRAAEASATGSAPAAAPTEAGGAGGEEYARMRREMAALRASMQELTTLAQTAQAAAALKSMSQGESPIATKLLPVAQWKNAGKATPEAATETALWAAVGGDVDTLANSFAFTPSSRAKADAWFASLSDTVRQQYGSPEKVIALMVARDAASLSGMQVLGKKDVSTDDVGLRIRFEAEGRTKDDTFLMRRSGDGWRMLLPDQAVESFAKKLSGKR
jgi:hypothetical protein